MCQSKAEGGMRCAAHTRPAYVSALNAAKTNATSETLGALAEAARAYAATNTGGKAVQGEADNLATTNTEVSRILNASRALGLVDLAEAKAATKTLEQDALRRDILVWANEIPTDPYALERYEAMLAQDMSLDGEVVSSMIANQAFTLEENPSDFETGDLEAARYITLDRNGQHVGTGTDPVSLHVIASFERMASKARRSRREQLETVDNEGRRWVMYENEKVMSEVLQSVRYDEVNRALTVTLRPKSVRAGDNLFDEQTPTHEVAGPEYTYHHVSPSMVRALVSARSMGRFYAYVFSGVPNGGSLGDKTANDVSFAVHAANNMTPITNATGPVPVKIPSHLVQLNVE
jgi:KTSC domain